MPFPKVDRVIFSKNPLANVICQFRFPPILKIDSDVPAAFQELIREKFPFYKEKNEITQQIDVQNKKETQNPILSLTSAGKNHEFSSEDEVWRINLTRTFIALSTSKYDRWEFFYEKLLEVINSFKEIYSPQYITRVGLRYVDIFDREKLDLTGINWIELIRQEFLGLLATDFHDRLENLESMCEVKLADNESIVRIATSIVKEQVSNNKCFMVDSDFYNSQKRDIAESLEKLGFLHERATRLICYIIKEKLHESMHPVII